MSNPPKTPEEVMAAVKQAVDEGRVAMAEATQAELLDDEIQEIFIAVRIEDGGKIPKRPLGASDQSVIWDVILGDRTPNEVAEAAGKRLGIELSSKDLFVDAALRLRASRAKTSH